jgi:hypothetical protein
MLLQISRHGCSEVTAFQYENAISIRSSGSSATSLTPSGSYPDEDFFDLTLGSVVEQPFVDRLRAELGRLNRLRLCERSTSHLGECHVLIAQRLAFVLGMVIEEMLKHLLDPGLVGFEFERLDWADLGSPVHGSLDVAATILVGSDVELHGVIP